MTSGASSVPAARRPRALARALTAQAFDAADANRDGVLSFEEFSSWATGASSAGDDVERGGGKGSALGGINPLASDFEQGLVDMVRGLGGMAAAAHDMDDDEDEEVDGDVSDARAPSIRRLSLPQLPAYVVQARGLGEAEALANEAAAGLAPGKKRGAISGSESGSKPNPMRQGLRRLALMTGLYAMEPAAAALFFRRFETGDGQGHEEGEGGGEQGALTRVSFCSAIEECAARARAQSESVGASIPRELQVGASARREASERLFSALDTDGSGDVDRRELVAGLGILSGVGQGTLSTRAAFAAFEQDLGVPGQRGIISA